MSKLPRSQSGDRVVKAFERLGYVLDHQKGSHMVLYRRSPLPRRLTVPKTKCIKPGLLRALLRQSGIDKDRFMKCL